MTHTPKELSDLFNKLKIESVERYEQKDFARAFPRFMLELFFNLNSEDIEEAVRGLGSQDDGLDAFFIDEDKKVIHLVQFKSRTHFNQKEYCDAKKEWFLSLLNFKDHTTRPSFKSNNRRIKDVVDILKNESFLDYTVALSLFHLGHCSDMILENFPDIAYYGMSEILERYKVWWEKDIEEPPSEVKLKIHPVQNKDYSNPRNFVYFTPKGVHGKQRSTLVFPISGDQLINLMAQGTHILERNVRGWLGHTNAVNKDIIKTIENDPDYFYYYNNGVSITCTEFELEKNSDTPNITLKNPQIINGAQTVNCLFYVHSKQQKSSKAPQRDLSKVYVLCRIMESNKQNMGFAKNLTYSNNRQNKIKHTDFYSERPEQKKRKDELKKFGIEYSIKRGKEFETKKTRTINLEKLAEIHAAQTIDPFHAKSSTIFTDSIEDMENIPEDSIYTKIFGKNGNSDTQKSLNLAISFYVYERSAELLKNIKATYDQLRDQINELTFNQVVNSNKEFLILTKSKPYFKDLFEQSENAENHLISKYIHLMDLKIFTYVIRQMIDYQVEIQDQNETIRQSKDEFQRLVEQQNFENIKAFIDKFCPYALDCYARAIDDMLKTKVGRSHSHPRTKQSFSQLRQRLSDCTADLVIKSAYDFRD